MALIERITLPSMNVEPENASAFPGLRISIRSTTSSLSDYPEWRLEELKEARKYEPIVTDGACS